MEFRAEDELCTSVEWWSSNLDSSDEESGGGGMAVRPAAGRDEAEPSAADEYPSMVWRS